MSGPFGSSQWMYASGGFYPYEIDQSVRFNDNDSAYLSKLWGSAGNQQTFTYSFWIKRANIGSRMDFISFQQDVPIIFNSDTIRVFLFGADRLITSAQFRDVSAWYHIVLTVDSTDATSGDRIKLYVNGERQTDFSTESYPSLNANANIYTGGLNQYIGRLYGGSNYFDGYVADMYYLDGIAADASSFGETKAGIWVPIDYTGSYGTNGFKLAFQDSASLGDDTSGNGHDFTANNLAATDQMPDSPTDNRITFNGLSKDLRYSTALTDGNKTINFTSGSTGFSCCPSTIFRSQGQAYCEFELDTAYSGDSGDGQAICVFEADADIDTIGGGGNSKLAAAYNGGGSTAASAIYDDGVSQGAPTKFTTVGQRIGVYIDYDAGKGWFSHEGTVQTVNGTPDISAGTNPHFTFTANTPLTVGAGGIHAGTPAKITMHDHPDDWETTPPSGYTAFAAVDLPDPGIDPAADEAPTDYFNTVLYTGNETVRSITGVGFQPDWVWIKRRSSSFAHNIYDVIRGSGKHLNSDSTSAESTTTTRLTAFESDGFALGTGTALNQSGGTYVAWNWKAGGTAVSNTDGSITSSVSASPESGFSVLTYTGPGASGGTIGHGLGKAPSMIIVKNRSAAESWRVYHSGLTATKYLNLNATGAAVTSSAVWSNTEPTASVFSIANDAAVSGSGNSLVAYCFADIDGMVKAGSHVGNGSTDGPFLYTGFRPAFVMFKRTDSTSNWSMFDAAREPTNVNDSMLYANASDAEIANNSTIELDFVSNGIKLRDAPNQFNVSGATYVYLAFAEQPFKYANAR